MPSVVSAAWLLAAIASGQENYLDWPYSMRIYLNTGSTGAQVSENVTKFPVLVRLTPSTFSAFSQTQSGGKDIRFAKPNGAHLSYEIERWVDGTGNIDTAEIWVRTDTVRGGGLFADQYITMYWGRSTASDSSKPSAVFDTASGFKGVWHLKETGNTGPGGYKDATGFYNGTGNGMNASSAVAGQIGICQRFDSAYSNYVALGNIGIHNNAAYTVMMWVRGPSTSGDKRIYSEASSSSTSPLFSLGTDHNGAHISKMGVFCRDNTDTVRINHATSTGDAFNNNWHYIAWTDSGGSYAMYVDSVAGPTGTYTKRTKSFTTSALGALVRATGSYCFNGFIDEAVVAKRKRSAGWIRLCYENQRTNQKLLCYPAVITGDPSNATVDPGQTATFSVAAAGSNPAYSWQKSGNGGGSWSTVTGATAGVYQFTAAASDTGTSYRCIVTGYFSGDTSAPAALTVCVPTVITAEPGDAQVKVRDTALFSVASKGYSLGYRWQRSNGGGAWNQIGGATASFYTFKTDSSDTNARFRCVVSGVCGSNDTSRAAILTLCYEVIIGGHPRDTEVTAGQQARFSVTASSGKGISYQWQRWNSSGSLWLPVSGGTAAVYAFSTIAADSGARFRCVLSPNPYGNPVTSNEAVVSVCTPPSITAEPHDTSVNVGDTAAFVVAASGTQLTYLWQRSNNGGGLWSVISGATASMYKFKVLAGDTGSQVQFRCVVNGRCGSDTSVIVRVGVGFSAVIAEDPSDIEVILGQQALFRVRATGTGLGYQWDRANPGGPVFDSIPSANGESYLTPATVAADGGARFRCRVHGAKGGDTSRAATLSIGIPVSITSQPADDTVPGNGTTDFSVTATGTLLSYQWERSRNGGAHWFPISGVTSNACRVSVDTADDGAFFRCVVTGKYGGETSRAARLTLRFPIEILKHPVDALDVNPNQHAAFSIVANGVNLRYNWEKSFDGAGWNAVPGATSPRYDFIVQNADHGYKFRCRISAACNDTVSNTATLTVCSPVAVTLHPVNQAAIEGRTARFTVSATGTDRSYQWQRKGGELWDAISGAIDTFYAVETKLADNGAQFRCVVSGKCGSDTSNEATLTVYARTRADFKMSDSIGPAPLTVLFLDSSSGHIGRWRWRYDDGTVDTNTTSESQVHRFDSARVFTVTLVVDGAGGIDSMSRRLVVYSKEGNPIVLTGRYIASDSVELIMKNYGELRTEAPPPFVSSIKLWRRGGALPADTAGSTLQKLYDLSIMKAQGNEYRDKIKVPPLSPADSLYGFMTQIAWNDNRTTPLMAQNGCAVLMRDTVRPVNRLALSAGYAPWDTVTFFIDSIHALDTPRADSVGMWYGLENDSTPDFGNTTGAVKWWSVSEIAAGASGDRFTYRSINEQFNTDRKKLTCAAALLGKNHLTSAPVTRSIMVGRVRPGNPVVLHATTVNAGTIRLSWNRLAVEDSVERIRVYYRRGDTMPFEHDFSGLHFDSIAPEPGVTDTEAMAFRLNEKTRYYFGAQVYKKGLWSRVTNVSRASDSTTEGSASTITNTISLETVVFDTGSNVLRIRWRLDTLAGTNLAAGISYSYTSGITPADTAITLSLTVKSPADSADLPLGPALLFDRDIYIHLWLKKNGEKWAAPTPSSIGSARIPPFAWQAVRYEFDFDGDTSTWVNGAVRFITPAVSEAEKGSYTGKIRAFALDGPNSAGFVAVGPCFVFSEKQPSAPFTIGLSYTGIPQHCLPRDARIYRFDGNHWLVDRETAIDTCRAYASIVTNRLDMPFAVLIDTVAPLIIMVSKPEPAVGKMTRVFDTIDVSDNAGNPAWKFRCARGGDPFALGDTSQGKTIAGGAGRVYVSIKDSLVNDENGVRAWFVADDGRRSSFVDLSRRVVRERSDVIVTPEMRWMPLRVTAALDSPSARRLLRFLDTAGNNSQYDSWRLRLFRWHPDVSNAGSGDKWMEYTPEADSLFTFVAGRLVWIKTRHWMRIHFGRAVTLSLRDTVTLPLNAAGWTDFAVPFRFNIRVGDLLAATRRDTKYADSLQIYQWVRDSSGLYHCAHFYIATLHNSGHDSLSRVMSCRDLTGFTIYNPHKEAVMLRVPPVPESMSAHGAGAERETQTPDGWTVRVITAGEDGSEFTPVYCGYEAGGDRGGIRYYPPPPRFEKVEIGVVEERTGLTWGSATAYETKENGCAYLVSLRNEGKGDRTLRLRLERAGAFAPEMKTALYDAASETAAELGDGAEYAVAIEGEGRAFRWLFVGDASYIASAASRWVLGKLSLVSIYPNPLRGRAHLRYTVPFGRVSRVEFAVLDIRGRVLWRTSVHERSVFGGVRDYVWHGSSDAGARVAAGVYVVKMTGYDLKQRVIGAFKQRITKLE